MTSPVVAEILEGFARNPYRFLRYRPSIVSRAQAGGDYGNAFIHPDYIREKWGQELPVLQHLPGGMRGWQDVVIMSRR